MSVDYSINLLFTPASLTGGDPGLFYFTAQIRRTGVATTSQRVRLQLAISGDHLWDGGDTTLFNRDLTFSTLSTLQTLQIGLNLRPSAVARGSFNVLGRIDALDQYVEPNELNNQAILQATATGSDVVLQWISSCLTAVMAEGQQGRGVGPTTGTRLMAMLSTAIYDTVCGFNSTQTPYRFDFNAPGGASMEAAVIGAASRVLNQLLPQQADFLASQLTASLARLASTPSSAINLGMTFGQEMADRVLASRAMDGSSNDAPYIPPSATGYVWRPQLTGPTAGAALGPNWGGVTPFAISNANAYMPVGGLEARPDRDYNKYVAQLEEVRLYGGLSSTATSPVLRTADQTQMAKFWAYDRPDTYRPYGQLNQIAVDLSLQNGGQTVEKNAALFAALNVALADAVIVAWKAKYQELQPRPSDLITGQTVDANGLPIAPVVDTQWKSLLSEINGFQSPPFPDYLSGHSAMGGVFSEVMTKFFGNNRPFDVSSQEMAWSAGGDVIKRYFNGYWENGVYRNSFYQAGWEDALSRVYGGVHIREACEDSFFMGREVGQFVAQKFSQPA